VCGLAGVEHVSGNDGSLTFLSFIGTSLNHNRGGAEDVVAEFRMLSISVTLFAICDNIE
jgi:hypothetical protein